MLASIADFSELIPFILSVFNVFACAKSSMSGRTARRLFLNLTVSAEKAHQDSASDGLSPFLYSMACHRRGTYMVAAVGLTPCDSRIASGLFRAGEGFQGKGTSIASPWDGRVRLLVKYERRNRRSDRPQALLRSTVYNSRREDRRGSGLAPAACVGGRLVMLCSPLDS